MDENQSEKLTAINENSPAPTPRASEIEPSEWYKQAAKSAGSPGAEKIDGNYNPKASNESEASAKFVPVRPLPEGVPALNDIAEARKKAFSLYRKTKIINYVLIGVTIVLVILCLVFALMGSSSEENNWTQYVIWPLFAVVVVLFIVDIVISRVGRKRANATFGDFLEVWENDLFAMSYLQDENVADAKLGLDAKAKDVDVINTHYWAVINRLDSRARFVASYLGQALTDTELVVDCPSYSGFLDSIQYEKDQAVDEVKTVSESASDIEPSTWYSRAEKALNPYSHEEAPGAEPAPLEGESKEADGKKAKPRRSADCGAFGKFITWDYAAKTGDTIIIVRKTYDTYLPTNVAGLIYDVDAMKLLGEDFEVWSSSKEFSKKVLTPEMVTRLQDLTLDSVLLDWFFCFNKHETAFMLNLSDDVMELPFRYAPAPERLDSYAAAVRCTLRILQALKATKLGD